MVRSRCCVGRTGPAGGVVSVEAEKAVWGDLGEQNRIEQALLERMLLRQCFAVQDVPFVVVIHCFHK